MKDAKSKNFWEAVLFLIHDEMEIKSIPKLATALKVSKQNLYQIEKGKIAASIELCDKLITQFNINKDFVFKGQKPIRFKQYKSNSEVDLVKEKSSNYGLKSDKERISDLEYTIEIQKALIQKLQSETKAKAG